MRYSNVLLAYIFSRLGRTTLLIVEEDLILLVFGYAINGAAICKMPLRILKVIDGATFIYTDIKMGLMQC